MNEQMPPVRVILDSDGYLIRAGDPKHTDKTIKKEILDTIESGGSVKTIPYTEYLELQWTWDNPKNK